MFHMSRRVDTKSFFILAKRRLRAGKINFVLQVLV
jgi:hypothetical protein